MKIVPATEEDIPQLVDLIQFSYRGGEGWAPDNHLLGGERVNSEMIKTDLLSKGLLWKGVSDDDPSVIIGCVHTEVNKDTNMLYVGTLCVHPNYQTHGLGKKLMHAAEERAKSLKCNGLSFFVIRARTVLIKWYERQGYKLIEEKVLPFPEGKYGDFKVPPRDLDLLTLEKYL